MSIIIGGCGSTGTSLLRQVLNRHSLVYIAPETHLFAKSRLYKDWKTYRSNINRRSIFGLRTSGMTMFTGFDLRESDFGMSKKEIESLAKSSSTFQDFVVELFNQPLSQFGKKVWGEKTPNNVYHLADLKLHLPESVGIFMYRNPYDTIASLVKRGYSVSQAVSRCLMTFSFGLRTKKSPNIINLPYEDLVSAPVATLKNLLKSHDLEYEDVMLTTGKASEEDSTQMTGWLHDESSEIASSSIGRFDNIEEPLRDKILYVTSRLRIKDTLKTRFGLKYGSVKSLCKQLGYTYYGKGSIHGSNQWVERELSRMKLQRSLRGYPQPFKEFPIRIS